MKCIMRAARRLARKQRCLTSTRSTAGALVFIALAAPAPRRALAHGSEPAQALSVVAIDAQGPSVVRLNEGLAVRRPEGWRFVCPQLWGEEAVVPALAIPGGPTLIGASTGLFVMDDDGAVLRHADPAAAGRVITLGASAAGLFALHAQGAYEVLVVQRDAVRVLWSDTRRWADMAVADAFISLMRIEAGRLFELRLTLDGTVLAEREAPLPTGASGVRARLVGDVSYALVLTSALTAELGRIEQGGWLALQRGSAIAGPLESADGRSLLALDAALARFEGEQLAPLAEPTRVTCLGRLLALDYACSEGGLHALEPDGLGATLFTLDALLEPELEPVPHAAREACTLQWQRYAVDLLQRGITPRVLDGGAVADPPDAAVQEAGADAALEEVASEMQAETPAGAAFDNALIGGEAREQLPDEPPVQVGRAASGNNSERSEQSAASDGCDCRAGRAGGRGWSVWLGLLGGPWLARSRVRRHRSR